MITKINETASFQSRAKFAKNMLKNEKEYAKTILDYPIDQGYKKVTNRELLKEYSLNLEFKSNSDKIGYCGIEYTPTFNICRKESTSIPIFEKIKCGSGRQTYFEDLHNGALNLKKVLDIANAVKKEHKHNDYSYTNIWQKIIAYIKVKNS